STGKVFVRINQVPSGNTYRLDSTSSYPTDGTTWMHIAFTYDRTRLRLYINGVEEASLPATVAIATNDLSLGIGSQSDGINPLQGAMDDVRVYNRTLNANEVGYLFAPPPVLTDLSVTVDDGKVVVVPGEDVTYTVVVNNHGPD